MKKNLLSARDKFFRETNVRRIPLNFSVKYSLLVEEYIRRIAGEK
jgi:hypothetical protein